MTDPRLVSQSFLGPESEQRLEAVNVGIVGLCGGGSPVVQQLAHAGVGNFTAVDFDVIEEKNRNRAIGSTAEDVVANRLKVDIARRVINSINPRANVVVRPTRWQDAIDLLVRCDVVFGCVDTFRERDQLERFCRRFLIPYLDLGMDVRGTPGNYTVSGQVVLSSPGGPCLRCLGIVTDERLTLEAERYGAAGSRPQVVWPNGVLASIAVGLFIQLINPWHNNPVSSACLEYDGNSHRVESNRMQFMGNVVCRHHPVSEVGDALFARLQNAS